MKKKRNLASFFAGVMTVLLAFGCLTSAMAASGEVTYNFANVTLNGEKKISAGSDITVANGEKAPSSILYTDVAGGQFEPSANCWESVLIMILQRGQYSWIVRMRVIGWQMDTTVML